jgi:hypothetical protein
MVNGAFVKGVSIRLRTFQDRKDDTGLHTAQYNPLIFVRSWQTVGHASEEGNSCNACIILQF